MTPRSLTGQPEGAHCLLPPLLERHQAALELIRSRAEERDGTIFFDITDHPWEGSGSD